MNAPTELESTRIDRWLWAVRIHKTRSSANAACTGGHVSVNGRPAKPAQKVTVGDRIEARVGDRERIVIVSRVIERRVGAAIAATCFEDQSPPPPDRSPQAIFAQRDPGTGRPTKRDRRQMDRTFGRDR